MVAKKRYTACLNDKEFTFVSDEPEYRVYAALGMIETSLQEHLSRLSQADPEKVALLVALCYAHDLLKERETAQHIKDVHTRLITHIETELASPPDVLL